MLGSLGGWASLLGANRAVAAALARIAAAVLPAAPRRLASLPAAVEQRPTAAPTATSANVDAATLFYRSIALKKYAQAIDAGRGYLLANPGDDAFAIDLASAYIAAGRFNDARDLLQKRQAYLRAHPQAVSVWMDLAYRESDARWYVRAIDDIDQYLAYRPGDAQAQGQRALDVAAITPQPDTLFYGDVQQKRYAEAIVYGRRYLAEHPDNDSFAMDLAYAEIAAGNVDAAAAIADRRDAYLRAHPQNAGLLAALFYAYKDRKALQRAIRYGDEYLSLRPNDDAFAVDLAFADLQAGRETASRALVSA
ncbi:MAG TPA: tetratricopeptide repeat protein, partial [Candidatus Baltobacteraceae bacterium]|nr:tetratricopeptide repeat protein [Candidatus Baltobacteraceae bacterium]